MLIPISKFATCSLCGRTRREITATLSSRKNGAFYLDKFCRHLALEHAIALEEYCEHHLGIRWPRCPVSGAPVGYKASGKGFQLSTYKKGVGVTKKMSPAVRAFAERMSVERTGVGNSMFGRAAWNKNLPADDPYREAVAARKRGLKASPATRMKMSLIRLADPKKARHTTPHSKATKRRLRILAAERHARGIYDVDTLPHCALCSCLLLLGVPFEKNYQFGCFCLDVALPEYKVGIECDGDFFHCNPAFYPAGPMCAIQRRNAKNDKAKNSFLQHRGWVPLRYWESDILSHGFVEKLRADLVKIRVLRR